MDSSAQSLDSLRAFRHSLYRCFERRADALFELTDALLTAGPVPNLRRGRLGVAPLRRGDEPREGILLPPQPTSAWEQLRLT